MPPKGNVCLDPVLYYIDIGEPSSLGSFQTGVYSESTELNGDIWIVVIIAFSCMGPAQWQDGEAVVTSALQFWIY